jgi:hypothetical protein
VGAGEHTNTAQDGADLLWRAPIQPAPFGEDHPAQLSALQLGQYSRNEALQRELCPLRMLLGKDRLELLQHALPQSLAPLRALLLGGLLADEATNLLACPLLQEQAKLLRRGVRRNLPLGAPEELLQPALQRIELPDIPMSKLQRLQEVRFRDLLGAAFDHDDGAIGAGNHKVHIRALQLREGRVDTELPVNASYSDLGDRTGKGDVRDHERGGGAGSAERVAVDLLVVGEDRCNDLRLVAPRLGEERSARAVNEACREHLLVGGASFAAEEGARNLPRSGGFLAVIHTEREEVNGGGGLLGGADGDQHHRIPVPHHHCGIGLARVKSAFQLVGATANDGGDTYGAILRVDVRGNGRLGCENGCLVHGEMVRLFDLTFAARGLAATAGSVPSRCVPDI